MLGSICAMRPFDLLYLDVVRDQDFGIPIALDAPKDKGVNHTMIIKMFVGREKASIRYDQCQALIEFGDRQQCSPEPGDNS